MRHLIAATVLLAAASPGLVAETLLDRLPHEAPICSGVWQQDSVIARLADSPLNDVEGIWQMLDDGATVAVERWHDAVTPSGGPDTYRMVMVESRQRYPRPGTLVGYLSATTVPGTFDARLYTDYNAIHRLLGPKRFTISVSREDRLIIKPVRSGIKIDLRRLLPYMFRFRISTYNTRPEGLDGAVRVWPVNDAAPVNPRYL